MEIHVTKTRSIVKTGTYRVLCSLETYLMFTAFYAFYHGGGDVALYATVALALVKTATYYLFERLWDSIQWGRYERRIL